MICEHCGTHLDKKPKDPWCMYKMVNGQVINKLFHPDNIPEGWYDSPKAAAAVESKDIKNDDNLSMIKKEKSNGKSARANR